MSIAELADAAGLIRRAIRFYVQQGLLPPPLGAGRGAHYDASHLERLRRIGELQAAGHSLDAIRRVLEGKDVPPPVPPLPAGAPAKWSAELWTRVRIAEGVEVSFDAGRHGIDAGKLVEIRRCVREILGLERGEES
jgi:DNA-binding transcriptional MerR regulator